MLFDRDEDGVLSFQELQVSATTKECYVVRSTLYKSNEILTIDHFIRKVNS